MLVMGVRVQVSPSVLNGWLTRAASGSALKAGGSMGIEWGSTPQPSTMEEIRIGLGSCLECSRSIYRLVGSSPTSSAKRGLLCHLIN